jgi:hypothetical protein
MSLLLTRHVHQYRIDVCHPVRGSPGPDRLGTGRHEPLADQLTVKPIMFHDQHALHGWLRQ